MRTAARKTVACSALAALLCAFTASDAGAVEWWMLQQTDNGRECGPPIQAEGVTLTPDVLMQHYPECKLMAETPSLDLEAVMVNCEGGIDRVFVFTKTKAGCERLAAD